MQLRLPTMNIEVRGLVADILDGYYRRTVERDLSLNPPGGEKSDG
jgi:hypothetical protein